MTNFITNEKNTKTLLTRLSELVKHSQELKFLVGFFYFSGISSLYKSLKELVDKQVKFQLKVLVGLYVDRWNEQLVEYADQKDEKGSLSNEAIRSKFFGSIIKSINTEAFDTEEFYEQSQFFIELIKNDTLLIRKTVKPNHAKLYIFKLANDQVSRNSLFITGSSNLTRSGISSQEEFNVEISDYGFAETEQYFDELWEKAIKITEIAEIKHQLLELVEKETLVKQISPFAAYALTLKIYLESFEKKQVGEPLINLMTKCGYTPYRYQLDAIEQALAVLEKYNGAILADVVGLGKTVIACAVARQLKKRGVIVCPPGLMGSEKTKDAGWYMYKEQFGLYDWEVWSLGDLEDLQQFVNKAQDIEVVIVDEAHRFRNQNTRGYELLRNICRNKQVLLLTATPFNNRPADVLSLLKLFVVPKKSGITLENNLLDKFRSFKNEYDKLGYIKKYYNSQDISKQNKAYLYYASLFEEPFVLPQSLLKVQLRSKQIAKEIRDIIEPVTIRRNRLDLQNNPFYSGEVHNLSKTADPIEWFFQLTAEQSMFYDTVIKEYFANPEDGGIFKGAIYRPFEYEKEIQDEEKLKEAESFEYFSQRNLFDFMRRLLVKRFESSFGSFKQSLENFKYINESVLEFIHKTGKYILDRNLLERIYDKDIEEIEKELLEYSEKLHQKTHQKNYKIYNLGDFKNAEGFKKDIQSDIELFTTILTELDGLSLITHDPKADCLLENLKKQILNNPNRKVVIFSEYIDTVKYLEPVLEKEFDKKVLTVAGDLTQTKLEEIYKNFDASYEKQENKFDIILATDKLSEGFNLNRAGMVINYDIPWNPVRVIQRLGRINRISKKVFDEIYIVNFFPTEQGAELVKSREIAANKMFLIHNTLGEDTKIFDIDEEPTPSGLYTKIQQNPDRMEQESFYTKTLREFTAITEQYPQLIRELETYPPRIKVARKYHENELYVFIKKGRLYIHCAKNGAENKDEYSNLPFEDVYEKVKANPEECSIPLSPEFWERYEKLKNIKETRSASLPEKSIEQQAINNVKHLLSKGDEKMVPYQKFLHTLLEDLIDYGTLSDYTLRRIAALETADKIAALMSELGIDYLEKEKIKLRALNREIIVAIENRKE